MCCYVRERANLCEQTSATNHYLRIVKLCKPIGSFMIPLGVDEALFFTSKEI